MKHRVIKLLTVVIMLIYPFATGFPKKKNESTLTSAQLSGLELLGKIADICSEVNQKYADSIDKEQKDILAWIALDNIELIEEFCRQKLFFTYGMCIRGNFASSIDNEKTEKVLNALRYGVKCNDPNCQFMLACVLSGNKTIWGYDDDYNKLPMKTPDDYKYIDDAEAQKYFSLFLNNPNTDKDFGPFGLTFEEAKNMIANAYPSLLK